MGLCYRLPPSPKPKESRSPHSLVLGLGSVLPATLSWHRTSSQCPPPSVSVVQPPRSAPLAPSPSGAGLTCLSWRSVQLDVPVLHPGTPWDTQQGRCLPGCGQVSHPFLLPLPLPWTCPQHRPRGQKPTRDILSRPQQDQGTECPTPAPAGVGAGTARWVGKDRGGGWGPGGGPGAGGLRTREA